MALVLLSAKSMTRAGIRAVTMRQVIVVGCVCLLVSVSSGFLVGMAVGQRISPLEMSAEVAQTAAPDPVHEKFAFSKLGEMAARLIKLEADARSMVKKMTALEALEKRLTEIQAFKGVPPAKALPGGANSGGQFYPARTCPGVEELGVGKAGEEAVEATESQINCLRRLISRMESAATQRRAALMSLPTRQPVAANRMGSPFGNRSDPFTGQIAFHSGLDFSADTGTPIHAAGGGKVSYSGWVSELGNVVEIDHGNGLVSRYAHCSRLVVKQGDVVTPGMLIAEVGSTGRSTGPHLHFEVVKNGMFVDPAQYLSLDLQVAGI